MPENTASALISSVALLQVIFIALKVLNVIAWDWIWVLAPMWVPAVFVAIVVGVAVASTLL